MSSLKSLFLCLLLDLSAAPALLVQTAVAQVFRLAVFRFATTGEAAAPFTNEQLESAFRQRRNRFR